MHGNHSINESPISTIRTRIKFFTENKGFCVCYSQVILITWNAGCWYIRARTNPLLISLSRKEFLFTRAIWNFRNKISAEKEQDLRFTFGTQIIENISFNFSENFHRLRQHKMLVATKFGCIQIVWICLFYKFILVCSK